MPQKSTKSAGRFSRRSQDDAAARPGGTHSRVKVSSAISGDESHRECSYSPTAFTGRVYTFGNSYAHSAYDLLHYRTTFQPELRCLGWRRSQSQPVSEGRTSISQYDETRPYKWWTYRQTYEYVVRIGSAVTEAFQLVPGHHVGIYAENGPWWTVFMWAMASQGITVVPIYNTMTKDLVEYVATHAEVRVIFTDPQNFDALAAAIPRCRSAQGVVLFESTGMDYCSEAARDCLKRGMPRCIAPDRVLTMQTLLENTKHIDGSVDELHEFARPAFEDDVAMIMYTSGTTGHPKGVVLKHRAFIASCAAGYCFWDHFGAGLRSTDRYISYLPMSHIFEQQAQALMLGCGGKIGYYAGDVRQLKDDMLALRPTIFAGVPRVYTRFQQQINAGVEASSSLKQKLFASAYKRQLAAEQSVQDRKPVPRSKVMDKVVFDKVRARLLPDVRLMITGSAPMSPQTNDFLKVTLGRPIIQGYGLTETVGGVTCSAPAHSVSGNCGGPLPGVRIKLVSVPEMGYTTDDKPLPRGEIWISGACLFSRYYKNKTATEEAFSDIGGTRYFKTGDIGQWLEDGTLQVIDRKKNLFKLAQGEFVSPEQLEQEYVKCTLVGQIWIYGSSMQSYLLAVVVPDAEAAKVWAEQTGACKTPDAFDLKAVAGLPAFKGALLAELGDMRRQAGLKGFEEIKDCIIETDGINELGQGFNTENNLLTPSMKLRRPQLAERYKDTLEDMYASKQG